MDGRLAVATHTGVIGTRFVGLSDWLPVLQIARVDKGVSDRNGNTGSAGTNHSTTFDY